MFNVQELRKLEPDKIKEVLSELTPQQLEELNYDWNFWARPEQLEPKGNWKVWVPLAGRGWGKTRCGAEWVRHRIKSGDRRVACVAPTKGDVRRVMVEGESGLLNICWKGDKTYRGADMGYPVWSPTNNTITWANGAKAEFFSAEDPERLRGPQFHSAWCFVAGTKVLTNKEVNVEEITVGTQVLTRKGLKKVIATSERLMPVGKVTFSDGRQLVGTFDHPIMTQRGWVELGNLKESDTVCVVNVSNTGIKSGVLDQTVTTEKVMNGCTGVFTRIISGVARAMMFTIKTVTNLIIPHVIYKNLPEKNTYDCTTKSADLSLDPLKVKGNFLAKVVEKFNFVTVSITKGLGAYLASKREQTKKGKLLRFASSAGKSLEVEWEPCAVKVASIWQPEGEQLVYNIQLENTPEYFANGILTHNCDEICAWTRMEETWDMLQFTLRLGKNPRILVTTTPKPVKLLRNILKPENIESGRVYKTSGSSYENSDNIDLEALSQYEGTRLGRQELYAEILDESAGALWNRKMIDDAQFNLPENVLVKGEDNHTIDYDQSRVEFARTLVKVVVSVDPAVSANEESDMTGIIVAGIDISGNAYIIEDATDMYMPEQWASKAVSLYNKYEADLIVAERNQGGEMVRSTLRTVDETVPIKLVHASRGKFARAEPVSALYERGKVKHLKYLESLEEQMVTWEPLGSIGSPDRLDAMVWAVTNLLLKGYAQAPVKIAYNAIKF